MFLGSLWVFKVKTWPSIWEGQRPFTLFRGRIIFSTLWNLCSEKSSGAHVTTWRTEEIVGGRTNFGTKAGLGRQSFHRRKIYHYRRNFSWNHPTFSWAVETPWTIVHPKSQIVKSFLEKLSNKCSCVCRCRNSGVPCSTGMIFNPAMCRQAGKELTTRKIFVANICLYFWNVWSNKGSFQT